MPFLLKVWHPTQVDPSSSWTEAPKVSFKVTVAEFHHDPTSS